MKTQPYSADVRIFADLRPAVSGFEPYCYLVILMPFRVLQDVSSFGKFMSCPADVHDAEAVSCLSCQMLL